MQGVVEGEDIEASWNLRFRDHSDALHHFPSEWMYERPFPKTKLLSPHPNVTFDGILQIGDERISIEEWPGNGRPQLGCRARRELGLDPRLHQPGGRSRGYVDLAAGRVRVGPVVTPWVLNGQVLHDGEEYRVGGFKKVPRTKVDAEADLLHVHGARQRVHGSGQGRRAARRASSAGSTPTRRAPTTTRSTPRSPTST